jgi:hypothetical protein
MSLPTNAKVAAVMTMNPRLRSSCRSLAGIFIYPNLL